MAKTNLFSSYLKPGLISTTSYNPGRLSCFDYGSKVSVKYSEWIGILELYNLGSKNPNFDLKFLIPGTGTVLSEPDILNLPKEQKDFVYQHFRHYGIGSLHSRKDITVVKLDPHPVLQYFKHSTSSDEEAVILIGYNNGFELDENV